MNKYGKRILADGISISNDTKETGLNNNDLIIGSSGSGKTGGYVIPNLRNITGSLVVSDTKGQLERLFRDELIAKGWQVKTLDLVDPLRSCGYNPLDGIRKFDNGKYREQDILTLANTIMPPLDDREPFWQKAAAGYIAFLIAYCLEAVNDDEHNMHSVCRLHQAFISPNGRIPFLKWAEENPDSFAARKLCQVTSLTVAERTWSSVAEFANIALEPFDFEEAKAVFAGSDPIDISDLGREKTVLFLNVSDTNRAFDILVNIFYTQALQLLCSQADANPDGRLNVPVRIIMDDFGASARIPDFDKIISVIRSRDISVSIILQSMTQLESMYSHAEALTIINNCDHILYLGSQDIGTAEYIGYRAYKTPEAVMCMPRTSAILMTSGEKAVTVSRIKPYSMLKADMQEKIEFQCEV